MTYINNSFIATLEVPGHRLNLLESLYGGPALATELLGSGGFYSGRPQNRDDSNLLGFRKNEEVGAIAELQLFFSGTLDGYAIYALDAAGYTHSRIIKNRMNILGSAPLNTDERTIFNLVNEQGNIITLDDLRGDNHRIKLKTQDEKYIGGLTLRGSSYHYISEVRDNYKMTFNLKILDRL